MLTLRQTCWNVRRTSHSHAWLPGPFFASGAVPSWHFTHRHTSDVGMLSRASRAVTTRGKKTKATLKLEDLPQGIIPLEPLPVEDALPSYPTVVRQARSNMQKFDNCVLLTRVGGFYELYFEHADEFGPLLSLKVAQKKTIAGPVSMAGFPFFQLDRYLKVLVQDLSRYVAIAEEFPNEAVEKMKTGGLMHDRKVSRVVTPGTLIDESFMDPISNNYVLALHVEDALDDTQLLTIEGSSRLESDTSIGLAWLDLSTGHFFTQSVNLTALPSFLARVEPREIVLSNQYQAPEQQDLLAILAESRSVITYVDPSDAIDISQWSPMLQSPISKRYLAESSPDERMAGSSLLRYIESTLQGSNMKLQPPVHEMDSMGIDKNTLRALEIRKSIREETLTGSLLHAVRRTVTRGGARQLDNWLGSPSTSLTVINLRQALVTHFFNNTTLREHLRVLLKRCYDSHRLLQKFSFDRGDPDDLLDLASTIEATQELLAVLIGDGELDCIRKMATRIELDGPAAVAARIRDAIDEDGLQIQHQVNDEEGRGMQALAQAAEASEDVLERTKALLRTSRKRKAPSIRDYYSDGNDTWIMKLGASPMLKRLHKSLAALANEKKTLGEELCSRLGATSLTLRYSPGLGHICHVKGKDIKLDLLHTKSVSSSKSTRSFHHPDWTNLGQRIDQCRLHMRAEEQRVFHDLRQRVVHSTVKLRRNAAVLDELDIACSFATVASEGNWTRPILNESCAHKIIGGRHPTVESGLKDEGRTFITNDCLVGDVERTWFITGPNMAGKSTFLRQNALITILAQLGSYVPAEYAELGIVDQIFSRVGSADNLYRAQSTFMVEMLETAAILKRATPRSFVIMDEIGRGTTPADGCAIAFACLHHLHHVNRCRTLFATHFHNLADLAIAENMTGIGFYCTDVKEDGMAGFRYIHRLEKGVNKQSHALKVARLAGVPEDTIAVAQMALKKGMYVYGAHLEEH